MIPVVVGLLAVCAAMFVSVVGLALVQRLVSPELRKQHNDVAGFIYAVVGIVYAVLLALVVVAVWEDYEASRETTDREANEGIPAILWVVLGVGGIVAVGFTYLFGLENTQVHRLMVATLAGLITLVLLTIGALDYPFSGDARIGPGAFELVLNRFETSKLSDLL